MRRLEVAAGLCIVVLVACNPQPKATPAPAKPTPHLNKRAPLVLDIKGRGTATRPVHLIQQVHNRVDYDLLASSYESKGPQGSARAVFQDARVKFRDAKGSEVAATAPQAVVDQTTDTVTLRNGVVARSSAGMTLHCTQLVYDRLSGMLHGTGDVVVTDPKGFRATGSRFDSDISLTHMRMQ
jgi:Lipopolysaccharide-assembly, LptC-related